MLCSVFVTAHTEEPAALVADLSDALASLGIDVRVDDDVVVVDGVRHLPYLIGRAHPTPADLRELVERVRGKVPAIVVADRISDAGRAVLRDAGWGWLDRRGHLRVWAPGTRVESPLPMNSSSASRRPPANAWTTVGLEIALVALIQPDEPITARRVAAITGRSVGATHEIIGRFAEAGLIGSQTHRPLLPELFWETSAQWPDDGWFGLPVGLLEVGHRVGPDEVVRVDERVATLGGARIAAAGDLPARCYVRSAAALRRVRGLADRSRDRDRDRDRDQDQDRTARCWVRAAPVGWLPLNSAHPADDDHPWSVAHPIVCALRLAADPARGREIVDAWGIVPAPAHD